MHGLDDNVVGSGIAGSNRFYINNLPTEFNNNVVVKINWDVEIHASVKSAIYPLLSDVIETKSLDALSKQGYSYTLTL